MQDWITWIIQQVANTVSWFSSIEILGVSVLWIIVVIAAMSFILRLVLLRP